ncbi:hypothetical protein [Arthrobacter psychrolactophilus]
MSNNTALATSSVESQKDFGWTLGVLVRNYQNASAAAMGEFPHWSAWLSGPGGRGEWRTAQSIGAGAAFGD